MLNVINKALYKHKLSKIRDGTIGYFPCLGPAKEKLFRFQDTDKDVCLVL